MSIFTPPTTPLRIAFEAWFTANNTNPNVRRSRKGYIDDTTRVAWRVWQHQAEKIDTLRDTLWVMTEHSALHHGENHNTTIAGRAALFAIQP